MKKFLFLCLTAALFSSCSSLRNMRYFNDLPDSTVINLPTMPQVERYIQEGDVLQISITGEDPAAAEVFNLYSSGTSSSSGSSSGTGGYLVAADGTIEFPYLGKTNAIRQTADQYKQQLTSLISKYVKNPLISVRFSSIKFTVLGEVRSPGTYTLPLQRTTFLDALGASGDLPQSAKLNDIQVYRDYNGKRTIFKVDLRKKDILFDSELFQIRHNDVIYVQPRESRKISEEVRYYTSLFSLAIGLVVLFSRF